LKFLLDTNVVSEWVKPRPNVGVVEWLTNIDESYVYISVITLMELRQGIDCMTASARRTRLDSWLRDDLPHRFEGRMLPIDDVLADTAGALIARNKRAGRPMSAMDALIGATAIAHGLKLVTRNVTDFRFPDDMIIDPWATK
jgi:toxin FitB